MRRNINELTVNGCVDAGCDDAETKRGGVTRTMFGGEVVPSLAQLSTQQSFASATSGLDSCISAASQQSISIMLSMPHSLSPKCKGIPAKVLPVSTSKRNTDASRDFICRSTLLKNGNPSQLSFSRPCGRPAGRGCSQTRCSNIHAPSFL